MSNWLQTTSQQRLPSAWERRTRTLHILDIENMVGEDHARGDGEQFRDALERYASVSGMLDNDPVMVGCHPGLAFVAQETLGHRGQIFARRGQDGGDTALLDALDVDFVAARFHMVSLGSGDHIFAPLVAELVGRGLLVTVIGTEGRTAEVLRRAASAFVPLPDPAETETETETETGTDELAC